MRHLKFRMRIFFIGVLKGTCCWTILVLLSSCTSVQTAKENAPYPANWPSLKISATEQCPQIGGLYAELAIEPTKCHVNQDDHNECKYLSYNFFPHHIGYKHVFSGPEWINSPKDASNSFVEIVQPNNNEIEVIVWYKDHSTKKIVSEHKFKKSEGDFSCDSLGLHVEDTEYMTVVVGTTSGKRIKSFMLDVDNNLVMKSWYKYGGYYWLFPGLHNELIWVRWPKVDIKDIDKLQ